MMRNVLTAFAVSTAVAISSCLPAVGQGKSETVVVTAMKRDPDEEFAAKPAIVLDRRADELLFEISLVAGSVRPEDQTKELEASFRAMISAAARRSDILYYGGTIYDRYDIDTSEPQDLINRYMARPSIALVVRVAIKDSDTFDSARKRGEDFVESVRLDGRADVSIEDEQYLAINQTERYRMELIEKIVADARNIGAVSGGEVELEGLQAAPLTTPSNDLNVTLYIPYVMTARTGD